MAKVKAKIFVGEKAYMCACMCAETTMQALWKLFKKSDFLFLLSV